MTNKKVLIVTYYWPPAGGPGVQRILKFAKYLPEFGWEPIILTVKNGEYQAIDCSLSDEILPGCEVYRTKALEPGKLYRKFVGANSVEHIPVAVLAEDNVSFKRQIANWIRLNLFIPDAKSGWIPFAVKRGKQIIKKISPDLIISSSPPPTVHLIANQLARWSGLKWIADFRDPWTKIHYYRRRRCWPSQAIDEWLERKIVERCTTVICVSRGFLDLLPISETKGKHIITNGFDEIPQIDRSFKSDKFIITHVGGITANRYYRNIFKDLSELIRSGGIPGNKVTIRFVGNVNPEIKDDLRQIFQNTNILEFSGYLIHEAAFREMQQSNLLLLFLEDVPDYQGHIPGKLFEYLITLNPIVGIGDPNGDSAEILARTNSGTIYSKSVDFKPYIQAYYNNWISGKQILPNANEMRKFSRKILTEKLAQIMDDII